MKIRSTHTAIRIPTDWLDALTKWRESQPVVAALDGAHSWTCEGHGRAAEARVHGVLRGGRVFRDRLYFHGPEPRVADLSTVTDLELLDL